MVSFPFVTNTSRNDSMHTKRSISVNFGACIQIEENFYFLLLQKKKKKSEYRTNLNFLTTNFYYFSGLVLIISVNSDLLVANANRRMNVEEIIALNKQKLLIPLQKRASSSQTWILDVYATLESKSAETLVKENTEFFRLEMNPTKLESKTADRQGKREHMNTTASIQG